MLGQQQRPTGCSAELGWRGLGGGVGVCGLVRPVWPCREASAAPRRLVRTNRGSNESRKGRSISPSGCQQQQSRYACTAPAAAAFLRPPQGHAPNAHQGVGGSAQVAAQHTLPARNTVNALCYAANVCLCRLSSRWSRGSSTQGWIHDTATTVLLSAGVVD